MEQVTLEVKSQGNVVATLEYECPTTLQEGVSVDGEKLVLDYYLATRKAKAMNVARAEATGTGGIGVRALIKALKDADPSILEGLKVQLGLADAGADDQAIADVE